MKKKKKEPKKRSDKYEKKLSIDGTLDEVLKVSVPRPKKK
jgi:dsDNA-binding SOS-regulon protein